MGEALSQLAFGKSCHQTASFSHRSLAHSAENRRLRFKRTTLTNPTFSQFGMIELTILIEGDDDLLTKYTSINPEQLEMITLDQLVPENHLVRKVEAAIDFSFIYSLVEEAYSTERGRPSIDPVVLIKITIIQYISKAKPLAFVSLFLLRYSSQ